MASPPAREEARGTDAGVSHRLYPAAHDLGRLRMVRCAAATGDASVRNGGMRAGFRGKSVLLLDVRAQDGDGGTRPTASSSGRQRPQDACTSHGNSGDATPEKQTGRTAGARSDGGQRAEISHNFLTDWPDDTGLRRQ